MKVESFVENDLQSELKLSGFLDEDADFKSIPKINNKLLIVDLSEVTMINSCGIRDWVNWTKTLNSTTQIHIKNCPKFIINQINVLQGFLPPNSLVLSFYTPYFCESCNLEKNYLFQRGTHFQESTTDKEAFVDYDLEVLCDQCKTAMSMDIIANKFFKFLGVK